MAGKRKVVKKKSDKRKGVKRDKHNVPDEIDLKLKQDLVDSLSKSLTPDKRAKPLTDNQIKALFRDAVRRKWMFAKVKLSFLESMAIPDYNPNTKTLWLWQCNICKKMFKKEEVEVDHLIGGDRDFDSMCDAPEHARGVLDVGWEDLQILCSDKEKGCHPIKSHAERYGMTFEEAKVDKAAIRWENENKGVQKQRDLLESYGVINTQSLKGKDIRQAYVEYLKSQEGKS